MDIIFGSLNLQIIQTCSAKISNIDNQVLYVFHLPAVYECVASVELVLYEMYFVRYGTYSSRQICLMNMELLTEKWFHYICVEVRSMMSCKGYDRYSAFDFDRKACEWVAVSEFY